MDIETLKHGRHNVEWIYKISNAFNRLPYVKSLIPLMFSFSFTRSMTVRQWLLSSYAFRMEILRAFDTCWCMILMNNFWFSVSIKRIQRFCVRRTPVCVSVVNEWIKTVVVSAPWQHQTHSDQTLFTLSTSNWYKKLMAI